MGKLFDLIKDDHMCWVNSHIAPKSYYDAQWAYESAEDADFGTMCVCVHERSKVTTPEKIKLYHEWIAYFMHGEDLSELEMIYRLQICRRLASGSRT